MKKFINKLLSKLIAQQSGDIVSLHKGSVQVLDAPKKSASAANQAAIRKDSSGTPKAALRKAIERGDFNGKPLFVPDVSKFDLELNGYNPALLGSGITSRLGSTKVLTRNRNRRINRYLTHMYLRLNKSRNKVDVFTTIALHFVQRSNSYLVASLLSQNKNSYRQWSSAYLNRIIKQINDLRAHHVRKAGVYPEGGICQYFAHVLKFHRTYIPKGNGKERPLGVPAIPWRVFTKMLLLPLQLINPVGTYQHGFIPRRGTPTAWNALSKEVLSARNIYEIDFEGFFPSVQPERVTEYLKSSDLFKEYLELLNESKPMFKYLASQSFTPETLYTKESLKALRIEGFKLQKRALPFVSPKLESHVDDLANATYLMEGKLEGKTVAATQGQLPHVFPFKDGDMSLMDNPYVIDNAWAAEFAAMPRSERLRRYHEGLNRGFNMHIEKTMVWQGSPLMSTPWPDNVMRIEPIVPKTNRLANWTEALNKAFNAKMQGQPSLERIGSKYVHSGLPQGSPLSPFLSILVLDAAYKVIRRKYPNVNWLFYADDGLFYSDDDASFQSFRYSLDDLLRPFGIKISQSKSQIVKQSGEFYSESLKFLGIKYDTATGKIYSETRKGNSLLYDFKDVIIFSLYLADEENIDRLYKRFVNFDKSDFPLEYVLLYLYLMWKMDQWPEAKRSVFFNRFLESLASDQKAAISRFIDLNSEGLNKALAKEARPRAVPKEFKEFAQPALRDEVNSLMSSMLETPKEGFGIFEGPFGGLIQSRLYLGSRKVPAFNTPTGSQDFIYRFTPNSLGHILASKGQGYINLANGSSYAAGEMVRLCRSISEGKRLPVFRAGPIKS